MPLKHSPTDKARGQNIKELIDSGYPTKQAVAIGYAEQRRNKKTKRRKRA